MSLRQLTPPRYVPPFTHRPGTKICLAGTSHAVEVYPTALRVYACRFDEVELVKELIFPALGPLSGWVAFVDPMHQTLQIQGRGGQGFVRYRVSCTSEGIFLAPMTSMMKVQVNGTVTDVQKSEPFPLVDVPCSLPRFPTPRLLLGCNKAPNLDRICDSPTMEEVLPLWYQLSAPSAESVARAFVDTLWRYRRGN